MKKFSRKNLFLFFAAAAFLFTFNIYPVNAQETADPCAPMTAEGGASGGGGELRPCLLQPFLIPGEADANRPSFSGYLTYLYRFSIVVTALLAVGYITYAGIIWATARDNASTVNKAKDVISSSLWGLGLALASFLILYTVNPELAEIKLDIPDIVFDRLNRENFEGQLGGNGSSSPSLGFALNGEHTPGERAVREKLIAGGIAINNEASCPAGVRFQDFRVATGGQCTEMEGNQCKVATGGRGCTSTEGLSDVSINKIAVLKRACDCSIVLTGGTEEGHQTHGQIPTGTFAQVVDLDKSADDEDALSNFILRIVTAKTECTAGGFPAYVFDGVKYVDEGNHWHVVLEGGRC